jgi:hypothetical protein
LLRLRSNSLEVPCGCCDFNACSDKSTGFPAIGAEWLICFVRTKKEVPRTPLVDPASAGQPSGMVTGSSALRAVVVCSIKDQSSASLEDLAKPFCRGEPSVWSMRAAESKSTDFPFVFNDHSEKSANFDPFQINGLRADSECASPGWPDARPQPDSPSCDCDHLDACTLSR